MNRYLAVYRAGETFGKDYCEAEQMKIADDWKAWAATFAGNLIDNSPVTRIGTLLSNGVTSDINQDRELINGYVIVCAESLDKAVDICRQCPLHTAGKTFEIRQLPQD